MQEKKKEFCIIIFQEDLFMEQKEKTIKSQEIFKGKILNLFVDEVKLPNGHTSTRELIRHCKASCVLAINEKNGKPAIIDILSVDSLRVRY